MEEGIKPVERVSKQEGERWEIPKTEKIISPEEKETRETRENLAKKEKASQEELQKEIEKISQSPQTQQDIKQKVAQIKDMDTQGKITKLVALAQERGVAFAISVAKDMNDPYLLDTLHDRIIEKGMHYKEKEK
jgi:hypothetical protein